MAGGRPWPNGSFGIVSNRSVTLDCPGVILQQRSSGHGSASTARAESVFEVLLPDGHKLWPDWLRRMDTALEDEAVIEVVARALERRWPPRRRRGRLGTPAARALR